MMPQPPFLFTYNNRQMDNNLTMQIGSFLKLEKPTDQQIMAAAEMLLRLDPGRERGIYNSAMRRPQALLPWIRTDLQKFYQIRMKGMTNSEAQKFNEETEKLVVETLQQKPAGVEFSTPPTNPEIKSERKKRDDHDFLPDNIKALWDKNAERWKKMREIHTQLELLIAKPDYQACDGNELCYALRQTDNALRADYKKYDDYKAPDHPETPEEKAQRIVKETGAARTCISRTLKKEELTDKDVEKLQDAVNTIIENKADIKPETIEKLKAAGVTIPDSDEQGSNN